MKNSVCSIYVTEKALLNKLLSCLVPTIPKCQLVVIKIDYSILAIFYIDGNVQLVIALRPDNCW